MKNINIYKLIILGLSFVLISCSNYMYKDTMEAFFELKKSELISNPIYDGIKEADIPSLSINDDTIVGIDSNGDGIRDDIEIWINRVGKNFNQRSALRQYALAFEYIFRTSEKDFKEYEFYQKYLNSFKCLRFIYDGDLKHRNNIADQFKFKFFHFYKNNSARDILIHNKRFNYGYILNELINQSEKDNVFCCFKLEGP
jgi:hypothetical protein